MSVTTDTSSRGLIRQPELLGELTKHLETERVTPSPAHDRQVKYGGKWCLLSARVWVGNFSYTLEHFLVT